MTTTILDGRPEPRGRKRPADGLPPHDVTAEEAIIAALMLDPEECRDEDVFEIVGGADFFREQNGWVFEAARSVMERGETVTAITVAHELDRSHLNWEPDQGWAHWLLEIAAKYFTAIGVASYARYVAADSFYRSLIAAAGQIASIAYSAEHSDTARVKQLALDIIGNIQSGHANVIPASHRFRGGVSLDFEETNA